MLCLFPWDYLNFSLGMFRRSLAALTAFAWILLAAFTDGSKGLTEVKAEFRGARIYSTT